MVSVSSPARLLQTTSEVAGTSTSASEARGTAVGDEVGVWDVHAKSADDQ